MYLLLPDDHFIPTNMPMPVAQASAEACPRKQRPHALGGTVEAVGEDPFDAVRRLLVDCCALILLIGLGKGRGTGLRGRAQVPEHSTLDNRGEIHLLPETVAMLLIR